ncbi:hypothetical protein [Arthrobacter antibioticus]|uniref:hypothetical protein n=1 Tax=Arthrobacter sp. H35-MC1 TaxID=3046203 RepID=UPI0024B97681|nr:hypothetical protein [Arthrobacter sp. H35-MC1]MDJ0318264.1 hypothetical protein [Arthrobacter sp. H35-MC1]
MGTRQGTSQDLDTAVVIYHEYGGTRMICTGYYKYVYRHAGPDELSELKADPQECHCLIGDELHAGVLSQLHQRLVRWFQDPSHAAYDGFSRPVTGLGQNSPVRTPLTDEERYERVKTATP